MGKIKALMSIGEEISKAISGIGHNKPPKQYSLTPERTLRHPVGGGGGKVILKRPVEEMSHTTEKVGRLTPVKTVHPDELVRQKAKILPAPGDRTPAGQNLTGINEERFDKPIYQGGGRDFGRDFAGVEAEDPLAWMSGKHVIEGFGKSAAKAGESEGPVMISPIAMGWQSGDFSGMMARSVIEMMKTAPMTAENKRILELALRSASPEGSMAFPTFDELWKNPDMLERYLGGSGDARRNLSRIPDAAYWQNRGAPDIASIRKANIAEEQWNTPFGSTGSVMYEVDPTGRVVYKPANPRVDYSTGLGGVPGTEPVGLAHEIPADLMFPDAVASMRANMAAKGSDPSTLTMNNVVDALGKMKQPQEATPEWRDNIMRYAERHGMKMAIAAGMITPAQAYTNFGYTGDDDDARL